MKIDFIADTNFLIYVHQGNKVTESFLSYNFAISFISEVEILGFKNISSYEELKLRELIDDCFVVE